MRRYFEQMRPFVAVGLVLSIGSICRTFSAQPDNPRVVITAGKTILAPLEPDPLNMPTDVAIGSQENIYVIDGVNHRVVVYDTDDKFLFQFGTLGSGPGQLLFPLGIATGPDGRVYVADSGNHRIQIFEPNGKLLNTVLLPQSASQAPPDPADIAIAPNNERLYITDNDNHHLLVYNIGTNSFESPWGTPGQGERQFRFPFLMDISSQSYLFVVEPINTRIQVFNPNGKFVNFIGAWGVKEGQMFRPKGVAVYGDKVFVSDSYLGSVQVFNVRGAFLGILADAAGLPMKFTTPTGITIDTKRKRLYVAELKANQISRVDLE